MLFEINGIRSFEDGKTTKLNFLISGKDQNEIREVLKSLQIVILSMKVFPGHANTFGDIFFRFVFDSTEYEIIINIPNIKEGYNFIDQNFGVDIKYINSFSKPTEDARIYEVLEGLRKLKAEYKQKEKEETTKQRQAVSSKQVGELRALITDTINDAEGLLEKTKSIMNPDFTRRLVNEIDMLKKYRISNNIEMMSEAFSNVMKLMEQAELAYIDFVHTQQKKELHSFVITDLDIIKEYEKYKRAQKMSKASRVSSSIRPDGSGAYYSFFGRGGIYLKLLFKDGFIKLGLIKNQLYAFFDYIELFLIFIVLELIFFMIYGLVSKTSIYTMYYYISFFGLMGAIVFIIRKIRRQSLKWFFVYIILGGFMFSIIRYLITIIFAF